MWLDDFTLPEIKRDGADQPHPPPGLYLSRNENGTDIQTDTGPLFMTAGTNTYPRAAARAASFRISAVEYSITAS
jgi:hypothetical protein